MTATDLYNPRRRIYGLLALISILALGLVAQLLRVQVFDRDRYVAWGDDQRLQRIPLEGQRGHLLDRNGEELAVSLPRPAVIGDPLLVDDPVAAATALAPVIGRDAVDIQAELTGEGRFVYLYRTADTAMADAVLDLGLPGVGTRDEPRRFHPGGDLLGRGVMGTVGVDNVGLSGLEKQYDEALSGTPGSMVAERSPDGRSIPDGVREIQPAIRGDDVVLTIERALQFEVERALAEHVLATGSKGGVVVITEPATGDILAMASVALTDDGRVVTTSDNRAVTWVYEPASVMKAVTFAAVLEHGIATPDSVEVIPSTLDIYDDTFTDDPLYDPMAMSVTDILVRSSNTGTITWADRLGATALHENLADFGFGQTTALDFPGESPGLLADVDEWSGTSVATISIGQGIAVTPLQMLLAYNVIANDGLYVEPRLVSAIARQGGDVEPLPSAPSRQVIDASTATQVSDILTQVVNVGTAQRAAVGGYEVAAKTGTARKVQEGGGYEDEAGNFRYVATVAGFFPAESPEFSMIVVLDEPTTDIFASKTAAPLFGELASWTLRHFQVRPAVDVVVASADPAETVDEAALGADGE